MKPFDLDEIRRVVRRVASCGRGDASREAAGKGLRPS